MAEPALIIDTPDGAIHARRSDGHPDRVGVLLHGGPGMSFNYIESLVPLLQDDFTVINYQQRGKAPTTVGEPFTVDAHVADARAVIDQAAGGRAWIVGHSWGGHLALHLLAAAPDQLNGAIIIDPLGMHYEVMEEFIPRLRRHLSGEALARVDEIEEREDRGVATPEESLECMELLWPGYFAEPASAPEPPDLSIEVEVFTSTMRSVREHEQAGTLERGLTAVPPSVPVLFIHGSKSPMPVRTTTSTAELIPHARVELLSEGGHFLWLEDPAGMCDAIAAFVADAAAPTTTR
jgi:proline iminopeptidase